MTVVPVEQKQETPALFKKQELIIAEESSSEDSCDEPLIEKKDESEIVLIKPTTYEDTLQDQLLTFQKFISYYKQKGIDILIRNSS